MSRKRATRLVERWQHKAQARDSAVLLSAESICRLAADGPGSREARQTQYLEHLRSFLNGFEVLPVLVIRRQDDFVRSLYQEHVMAGVGDSARVSFPEFLAQSAVEKTRFLDRLRGFREQFGVVRVLVYEELVSEALPVAFLRQLGVRAIDGCATPIVRRSLSVRETLVKQRLNKWIRGRYQNRLALVWLRSRSVQRVIESELGSVDSLWPDDKVRRAFVNRFDVENARIAAEFLDREGSLFPPFGPDTSQRNTAPESSEMDAVMAEVVKAARWPLQAIVGREAVSELLGG